MGAQLCKEVAERTQDNAGDGTTTATILTQAIIEEGLKHVTAGVNPMYLKRGLEKARDKAITKIIELSKEIKTNDEIAQIATISANNDSEIGTLIAKAMEAVGNDGIINVEEAKSIDTYMETVEGMQFDRGYISPYFVSDQEKMTFDTNDANILIYNGRISKMNELLPILQMVSQQGKPLLVIAEDVDGEALSTLVVNKLRGSLQVCAIKSPGFGDNRKEVLDDIAILTGGTVISNETGRNLKTVKLEDLGSAKKIIISKDTTIIREGNGDEEIVEKHINTIKARFEDEISDYAKDQLQERLAKLSNGVAVIKIGAATETEMKEKKARIDDALHATRAAVEEGIVTGGGVTLIHAAKAIIDFTNSTHEEKVGADILRKALMAPVSQIAFNAGESGDVIIARLNDYSDPHMGYNAATNSITNLFVDGVIDPAKVIRSAIQNAVSIAGLFLTTECIITDIKEENNNSSDMSGMNMF